MISFFNKNNKKKPERELELVERSLKPILTLSILSIEAIFLPDLPHIDDILAKIPTFNFLPNNAIEHYTPLHLNTQPVSMLLPDLNHIIHTNNRLNITFCNDFILRKSDLHDIINEQLLANLFAIKSVAKKLPINFVMEIAIYLFRGLNNLKVKELCNEILVNNETKPPPHPNYILR
jgi:hypothetical protein